MLLILLAGCSRPQKGGDATFLPYSSLYHELGGDKKVLQHLWENLPVPVPEVDAVFNSSWVFMDGRHDEVLDQDFKFVEGAMVELPHRLNRPNQSMWYTKAIDVPQQGVLEVKADDGSQLFINGKRIKRIGGNFFPLDESGKLSVTVRVLNNAMSGGLQEVRYLTSSHYTRFQNEKKTYDEKKALIQKVLLKKEADETDLGMATRLANSRGSEGIGNLKQQIGEYPYIAGPYLIKRGDSVSIMAVTDSGNPVELWWGADPESVAYRSSTSGGFVRFDIGLSDMPKKFFYRLVAGRSTTAISQFSNEETDTYSFNVWADSQSGWRNFSETMGGLSKNTDAFGVGIGDLVSEGCDSLDWIQFFAHLSVASDRVPFFLIPGNHDYDGYYDELKASNHRNFTQTRPYQSWSFGNSAFIALDPNMSFPIGIDKDTDQYRWFQQEISKDQWKNATWRFVFLHQPPYSQGWSGYHGDEVVRGLLEPVVESARIDFIVCGHTHNYERWTTQYGSQRVTFFIVGGAGGSLEDDELSDEPKMDTIIRQHHFGRFTINRDSLLFEAINHKGEVIDRYSQIQSDFKD